MPVTVTHPGIYIQELPSGVQTIVPVSTSVTAFIDFFPRGPMGSPGSGASGAPVSPNPPPLYQPTQISGMNDFNRIYGGLDNLSEASYQIQQFFLNGGSTAWVVRVADGAFPSSYPLLDQNGKLSVTVFAANPGVWGDNLQVQITANTTGNNAGTFNLTALEKVMQNGQWVVLNTETYANLVMADATSSRYAPAVVNAVSAIIMLTDGMNGTNPAPTVDSYGKPIYFNLTNGNDGSPTTSSDTMTDAIQSMDTIAPEVFNIMCLPGLVASYADLSSSALVYAAAQNYCATNMAFLLVDIPATVQKPSGMISTFGSGAPLFPQSDNSAAFYPRLLVPDPLNEYRLRDVPNSGSIAGIMARIDSARGVWKAPAGTEATIQNASLVVKPTDTDSGTLNPVGFNVLRTFPVFNTVVWGARTLKGADQESSQWKYIPVRRTAYFIEQSLNQGLKWVLFEPNFEPLWSEIRLNVGAFMQILFSQGAFAGSSPKEAYFVQCDSQTNPQSNIDLGIVTIIVGFAPLKPAEFVILEIQQMAGQLAIT